MFKDDLRFDKELLLEYIAKLTEAECKELLLKFKDYIEPSIPFHATVGNRHSPSYRSDMDYSGKPEC